MREMGVELGWKSRRAATGQSVRNKPADVEIKSEWMLGWIVLNQRWCTYQGGRTIYWPGLLGWLVLA